MTIADLPSTSTVQVNASPGSNPKTVATDWGTVVLSDTEPVAARHPIPVRTRFLVAVKKVHPAPSARRARGLMHVLYSDGKGLVPHFPNYAVPSRLFNHPGVAELLLELVEKSALLLRDLKDGGTVAVDSTGFCTTCRGAYCTEKHNPEQRHCWVKAHLIIGTKTHIVVGVRVTDESGNDSPQFIPLLEAAARVGFRPADVPADKAYLGRENLAAAARLGIDPFVPFKTNSVGRSHGSPMWTKKFHEFHAKREEFERHYHARSNAEAAISAIKRKLGEPLFSRNQLARFNELLAKILDYNIGVIVHEIYEHGIDPGVPGLPKVPPPAPEDSSRLTRDSMEASVTEIGLAGHGA